jgi:hypothetical protein
MNREFKLRFDQMKESNPTQPEDALSSQNPSEYETAASPRSLCLIWPSGKQMFFSYAYLISAEYNPEGESNEIKLHFSSHDIVVKGYGLAALFTDLSDHLTRSITAIHPRYASQESAKDNVVFEITVQVNE